MGRRHNLIGLRSGRLLVKAEASSRVQPSGLKKTRWTCACDCGSVTIVDSAHLTRRTIMSCGCLQKEKASDAKVKHLRSRTPEHNAWAGMKARCYNNNNSQYRNYGARGITVCGRWLHSAEAFLNDMGPKPSSLHSLDRIDNDGPYSPENCRWASAKEQGRNRRLNRTFDFQGRPRTLAEIAEMVGQPYKRLHSLLRRGQTIEQATAVDQFRAHLAPAPKTRVSA